MSGETEPQENGLLPADSLAPLEPFLGHLTEPVRLVAWASEGEGALDGHAINLCRVLANQFPILEFDHRPRQGSHPYHPIIGVMGLDETGEEIDYRIRFIGLPSNVQINGLVGAIQAVSFRAQTLEALTRIQLSRLQDEVILELFTTPDDEPGVLMATLIANLAVANEHIRANVVLVNYFPDLIPKYSIYHFPHTVINNRHHLEGSFDEEGLLKRIARVVRK